MRSTIKCSYIVVDDQLDPEDIDRLCRLVKLLDRLDRRARITEARRRSRQEHNLLQKETDDDIGNHRRTQDGQ